MDHQAKIKDYDQKIQAALDSATPEGKELADRLSYAKQSYIQHSPWGSEGNHPGVGGKLLHGLARGAEIAADIASPGLMTAIPGTPERMAREQAGTQATLEKDVASEAQLDKPSATANLKEMAGGAIDPKHPELGRQQALYNEKTGEIQFKGPGADKDQKDAALNQQYLDAEQAKAKADAAGDTAGSAKAQAMMDQIKNAVNLASKPEGQEANKLSFQATAAKINKAGGSLDPKEFSKSLDAAEKNGTITPQEAADARAYQLANPNASTTVIVGGEQAQQRQEIKDASKSYTWTDDQGTHFGKGNQVPAGAETSEVDPKTFLNEARSGNIVQQSLNRVSEDIEKHPEIFDNAAARNIMATTLEQIDRQSAGMLVAGTGGTIPLPSGLGDMINTALQNKGLDAKQGEALRTYIADYKAMKDKALVMQMEMQGGKIGRGNAMAFKSITDQIPNGATPDSKTAIRQLMNLQQTQNELMKKYPEKYQDYAKETPYQFAGMPKKGDVQNHMGVNYEFNGTQYVKQQPK
jgi:hypothetical protein